MAEKKDKIKKFLKKHWLFIILGIGFLVLTLCLIIFWQDYDAVGLVCVGSAYLWYLYDTKFSINEEEENDYKGDE